MRRFFLGVARPGWLSDERFSDALLFLSRNTIGKLRSLPAACTSWALDSGGFSELQRHGRWELPESEYVALCRRLSAFYGERLLWVAPQDWMCERPMLAKTGLSVEEHQRRTVDNFVRLRAELGDLVVPALQGWHVAEYWRCADMYADAGVDLTQERLVCVGSVCRRQATSAAAAIIETLAADGLRLHGFGFKAQGIVRCAASLESADSMAWSMAGRKRPDITHAHVLRSRGPGAFGQRGAADDCAACPEYALDWRRDLVSQCMAGAA